MCTITGNFGKIISFENREGDEWGVIGPIDGDGDVSATRELIAVVVCCGNGVGEDELFTFLEVIKCFPV